MLLFATRAAANFSPRHAIGHYYKAATAPILLRQRALMTEQATDGAAGHDARYWPAQ